MSRARAKETSTTSGTGATISLDGPENNYQSLVSGVGDGNTDYFAIVEQDSSGWEEVRATVNEGSPDTLEIVEVLDNSNGDTNRINLSGNGAFVFCTLPGVMAAAQKALIGATLITEAEGIASNDNDTTWPTSAAVKDYADSVAGSDATFFADLSANQTGVADNTNTKVEHDNVVFDPLSDYDNTTNFRYTPSVAGKYLVIGGVQFLSIGDQDLVQSEIQKNGSAILTMPDRAVRAAGSKAVAVVGIVIMDGSSDYLEHFARHTDDDGTDPKDINSSTATFFTAVKVAN